MGFALEAPYFHTITCTNQLGYHQTQRSNNQIDNFMIRGMERRSLADVRVKRGADILCDRKVLIVHLELKLKKARSKADEI